VKINPWHLWFAAHAVIIVGGLLASATGSFVPAAGCFAAGLMMTWPLVKQLLLVAITGKRNRGEYS